jgi:glycine/D-amino acid oxidase-like deaminating enzyme
MGSQAPSYLIIGAGVFGASTAYHLIRQHPDASVTLVDRDAFDAASRVAASWDWNKVVRADYADIKYCELALEAQDIWRTDPLWKPFFHESGIYWISRTQFSQIVIDNYAKLGRHADLYSLPVEEAAKLYGGIFNEADYSHVKEVLINNTSGWADARDALKAVIQTSVELGVKYVVAEVTSLKVDEFGLCHGVTIASGDMLEATHTILCTGSFTPKLLERSADASGVDELRAGERIISAGVTTGMTLLSDDDMSRFSGMPVCIQENPPERGNDPPTLLRSLERV